MSKHKLIIGSQRRIFFKHKNIIRFAYPLMILFFAVVTVSLMSPAFAVDTTKATALISGEMRQHNYVSYNKIPRSAVTDSCTRYLSALTYANVNDNRHGQFQPSSDMVGESSAPLALSLVLGVRLALDVDPKAGKKSVYLYKASTQNRHQMSGSYPRALAIAAYRGCKNDIALKSKQKKRDLNF